jgi:hypothetical protein
MAWSFGDSFDLYAAVSDPYQGYWDSGGGTPAFVAGRFAGSQAWSLNGTGITLVKSSGANDAVHHLVVSFRQTATITGSTLGMYLELFDGVTAQCSIVFRSDGAILLTSGGPAGTALATYTGAFPVINTWYAFEFEVVINNTTGSFVVRKNGNNVADFTATSLDTQNSANAYANKLQTGMQAGVIAQAFDDLFWRSDASSVAWLGDIRCYARMPASDASVTFSKAPTSFFAQTSASATTGALTANNIRATLVTAPTTGVLASLTFNFNAGITGHAKMALYDASGSGVIANGPGALLASSVELTNPGAGVNTFTVAGGPTVTRGANYWVALWSDVSITGTGQTSNGVNIGILALTYTTSFPATMTGFTSSGVNGVGSNGMNVTPLNAGVVNEPQQDALTSYVYDSNPGDADFYGVGSIVSTPATVIATTVRAYAQKSDAGTRTMAVQLKSGATTVASPTLVLTTSGWLWAWRTDTVDPNTGVAWTPAAVNNATIGPKVIA